MSNPKTIGEILAGSVVPNSGTDREQITYIDFDLLTDDKENFYSMDGVDELANNLQTVGLQQPIRVRPDGNGKYIIVSGHRRRAAIKILREDEPERWAQIPCIIEDHPEESDAMRELRLIFANSDTRRMSGADVSRQAERVEQLLYQLKEEGVEFPGRMRDHVAEACKVSKSKLSRLKVIREGLEQKEYRDMWDAGKLEESVAYELARFSPEMQTRIYAAVKQKLPHAYRLQTVREVVEKGCDYSSCSKSCKEHNPCLHNIRFLAHDLNAYSTCKTGKCCMECDHGGKKDPRYYGALCSYACSSARKKYEDRKANIKEKELSQEQTELLERKKEVREFASLVLRAANEARLSGKTVVHPQNGRGVSIGEYMEWAGGNIPDDCWAAVKYQDRGRPYRVSELVKLADELQCSTDYLLGRSSDVSGTASAMPTDQMMISGWMPGGTHPSSNGDCVVDFLLQPGHEIRRIAKWNGIEDRWEFLHGGVIMATPVRWMQLPDVPKEA